MAVPLPKAELVGTILETLAYGSYLTVFASCVQILRRKGISRGSNLYLGITAFLLFVLVTTHLIVDIIRAMVAFTSRTHESNASAYFENFSSPLNILKSATYVATTVISDAFMLYRTFVVWQRSYTIIALPFLLFLANIGIGVLWTYTLSQVRPFENVFADTLSARVKAFFAITLAFSFLCTVLIAFRIFRVQWSFSQYFLRHTHLRRALALIIESGAVYSTQLFVLIGCMANGSPAMFIFLNSISPVIGIVFSSVIIRVGSGTTHSDTSFTEATSTLRTPTSATAFSRPYQASPRAKNFSEVGWGGSISGCAINVTAQASQLTAFADRNDIPPYM